MRNSFTDEEKRVLREKYLNNITRLNKYLPNGQKLRPNFREFNRKINDPKIQRMYIKGMEIAQNKIKRLKLFNELDQKYRYLRKPDHRYFMNRTLYYLLDLRPGAEKYNEALVKLYEEHPEAVSQYAYQKAMEFNPGEILKIAKVNDYENLAIDFYAKNRIDCDFAYCINDGVDREVPFTEDGQKYMGAVRYNYQLIHNVGGFINNINEEYLTVPTLTDDQKDALMESRLREDDDEFLNRVMSNLDATIKATKNEVKTFSRNCVNGHYNIDRPGAFSYYVMKDNNRNKYLPFTDKLSGDIKTETELIQLDENTSKNIRRFYERDYIADENVKFPRPLPNDVMAEYLNEFRYRYALNNNKDLYKIEDQTLAQLHASVKKGFFEYIRNSTSQYTKDLQTAIKNFETPGNKDYQNKEKLKESAQAYLDHRGVHNRRDALRQSSAAKNRSLIALDIIAAVDATKEKAVINIDNDLEKDDNNINLINEDGKNKIIFVNPEEILNDGAKKEEENNIIKTNEKEDFSEKVKDTLIEEKNESDLDESNDEIDVDEIEKNIIIETGIK